jgi:hypothetical protein
MKQMESEGKLKTVYFKDRAQLVEAAKPVLKAYFEAQGVPELYQRILDVK